MSDEEGGGASAAPMMRASEVMVGSDRYDLNALFGFTVLQDLLRSMGQQQDAQMELIRKLREDLEQSKKEGDETAKRLKAEIDLKATEKALTALALETSRDKTAMTKKVETFEADTAKKFEKHHQRLETQQSKLYDVKVALDTKAEARTVDQLTTRVDGCATAVELADAKIALKARIDEVESATTARHKATEVLNELQDKRLNALEEHSLTLATKVEVNDLATRLDEADAAQVEETKALEARREAALAEAVRVLEARHGRAEETMERHWSHIRNVEELVSSESMHLHMPHDWQPPLAATTTQPPLRSHHWAATTHVLRCPCSTLSSWFLHHRPPSASYPSTTTLRFHPRRLSYSPFVLSLSPPLSHQVRTKADREMVQQGIDKAAADTAACDAKFTAITNEHIEKTDAWQANADMRLDSAEIRLDEAEASLKTKATLEETKDLREKVTRGVAQTSGRSRHVTPLLSHPPRTTCSLR